jgi:hypothetical protein
MTSSLADGASVETLPERCDPIGGPPKGRIPLSFLIRLQHEELPVLVAEPEEIRHVSVLSATGLIDANIPAFRPTARYTSPRLVTVVRITEEGRAWLTELGEAPKPVATSMQLVQGLRLM